MDPKICLCCYSGPSQNCRLSATMYADNQPASGPKSDTLHIMYICDTTEFVSHLDLYPYDPRTLHQLKR